MHALVEAVGKDVRELASACQQLIDDTTGVIDEQVVLTYHGGKVEATGFRVADAAMAGDTGEALRLLRHAIAVGVDPVPIVAVLAQQARQLIKVGSAGRGRSADLARDLGMAPWQVDKARRALGRLDRRRSRHLRHRHRRGRLRGQGRRARPGLRRRAVRAHHHQPARPQPS